MSISMATSPVAPMTSRFAGPPSQLNASFGLPSLLTETYRAPTRPTSSCTGQNRVRGGCGRSFLRISRAAVSTTLAPARSSPPRAVVGFFGRMIEPSRTGSQPTQSGTVSMCAIISRRGPRTVPGSLQIRLPTCPPIRLFLWAESVVIAEARTPASRSFFVMNAETAFSSPLFPGMAIISVTRRTAAFSLSRLPVSADFRLAMGSPFRLRPEERGVRSSFMPNDQRIKGSRPDESRKVITRNVTGDFMEGRLLVAERRKPPASS